MVFKISDWITSICPLCNGHRLLIRKNDRAMSMLSLEDLGSNQPVTQDEQPAIALLSSRKMVL